MHGLTGAKYWFSLCVLATFNNLQPGHAGRRRGCTCRHSLLLLLPSPPPPPPLLLFNLLLLQELIALQLVALDNQL